MQNSQLEKIISPLIKWYQENHRKLPWRENKEPYRIWVSEIMLQQTRVETVIPYYERFMKQLPDIAPLAACGDEELIKLWEGLGYYSRARNLKKAAQIICTRYQGRFPQKFDDILSLPGIGAYTAGAIASIAFEMPRAAVDGNVLRVITRLTETGQDIMDEKFRRQVTKKLEEVYPAQNRGDFTQSLMELGAVVCVPNGEPKCRVCPIKDLCGACVSGTQLQYPVKKKKPVRKIEQKTVLFLRCNDRIAIRKRGEEGVLSGMWELPNLDGNLPEREVLQQLSDKGIAVAALRRPEDKKQQIKHVFTHIEWNMTYWIVDCSATCADDGLIWVSAEQLENEIALPTAFKKIYSAAAGSILAEK